MKLSFVKAGLLLGSSVLFAGDLQENCLNLDCAFSKTLESSEGASPSKQLTTFKSLKSQKDSSESPKKADSFFCTDTERIQLGGNYTYAWITSVPSNETSNTTTTGSLGGLQAIYEHCPLWSLYGGTAFRYRIGSTSTKVETEVTIRELQDFNPQVRLGYTFAKKEMLSRATVFGGFGLRFLAETVTVNTSSIDFDYTEFYIPIGFLLERKMNSWISMGCNFQWMPQIFPLVFIGPLTGYRLDLTYQLLNFFLEIPIKFTFKESRYSLSVNPFFESWRDGATIAQGINLPLNRYVFTGLNLNFMASF